MNTNCALSNCKLCPRKCGVNRTKGEVGFCGAGRKVKIARAALHFWEEPCISGKNGSGTVFFSHCNMKCVYCQNYRISTQNFGVELDDEQLAEKFLLLQEQGANNINLVTPTHFIPQIITALDIAKKNGLKIPVLYNCSGYESVEAIEMLNGYIDIYMPDIKYFSDAFAVKYSFAQGYFAAAKDAVAEMLHQVGAPVFDDKGIMQKGVIVRHMMLPGLLFDSKKIIDYLYTTYHDDIYISLMSQYTPMPNVKSIPELNRKINPQHYEAMIDYCAEKGMKNVFVQEGSSANESFIPDFECSDICPISTFLFL